MGLRLWELFRTGSTCFYPYYTPLGWFLTRLHARDSQQTLLFLVDLIKSCQYQWNLGVDKTRDCGQRNTKKYNFRCPYLKELRKLSSFVLDPLDLEQHHGKLLSVLSTDVVEVLLSVLVQFYDPLYWCFTFPEYHLMPMLEEYSHLLGIPVSDKVPFNGLEEIPRSHVIAEALHLRKSKIDAHLVKKGGIIGLTFEFLIGRYIIFAQASSMDDFEAILIYLIYGLVLFPNIEIFVNLNAIRIFLIGNLVLTILGDMYFSWHLRNSKDSELGSLDIIDICGEFSYVPLVGTQEGINYNPTLARSQLGFPLRDKPNNTQLEGLFYQEGKDPQLLKSRMVKKRDLELKMSYASERPMFVVVAESSTLPKQDIEELEDTLAKMKRERERERERDLWEERFHALNRKDEELQLESKDKDALIKILENCALKRQREPKGLVAYSIPQPSGAWKKIVDHLVLEKAQMKTSFESEIRRIRRKYAPIARSYDAVARDP
ncbi:hypothetical protein KIW84_071777 [Lathyrus oleraceus]|uniref:DUF7745 domain-containing protein n=1 Tax=Pisum sativum TaxID=3888 RepID=A0A9D4VLH1_PEA|nr:hypothetical protein KIW84_071777 [Pisum sativum]